MRTDTLTQPRSRPISSFRSRLGGQAAAEALAQLITAKADVNLANRGKISPLMKATLKGHTEMMKQLIAAKADFNLTDEDGRMPASVAASSEALALLIDAKADVNQDGITLT